MISIIYGFIIAIFVILSGCFIRLGLILQEFKELNDWLFRKWTEQERTQ